MKIFWLGFCVYNICFLTGINKSFVALYIIPAYSLCARPIGVYILEVFVQVTIYRCTFFRKYFKLVFSCVFQILNCCFLPTGQADPTGLYPGSAIPVA